MTMRAAGQRRVAQILAEGATGADLTLSANALAARFLAANDSAASPGHGWQNAAGGISRLADGTGFDLNYAGGGVSARVQSEFAIIAGLASTQASRLSGDVTGNIAANQNDYLPTNGAVASVWRLNPTVGAINVTGLQGGADGRILLLFNVGGFNVTLTNQDALSTAANRMIGPGGANVVLAPGDICLAIYDSTTSRWRLMR